MNYLNQQDTIAAIGTALGAGAIALVRLTGPKAIEIAEAIFSRRLESLPARTCHYGKILAEDGQVLDDVLAVTFKAPHSFTGEDMVEFHCHGGMLIPQQVLARLLRAGARMALPGEFSSRAVCNGKLDLVQAEAIQSLIASRSEQAARLARRQLEGVLSQKLRSLMAQMTDLAGILEAWVDFPEEDLEFASFDEVTSALEALNQELLELHGSYQRGRRIQGGFTMALGGVPNAGKSSLMNALLGRDRAIVTEIPGTTRDLLEGELQVGGYSVRLLDTAGLRHTSELIEAEGIRRSLGALKDADLRLLVLDSQRGLDEAQQQLIKEWSGPNTICIWNKIDLTPAPSCAIQGTQIRVSARHGTHLNELIRALENIINQEGANHADAHLLTEERHAEAVQLAAQHLQGVIDGLQNGISAEYVAFEMRQSLQCIAQLLGLDVHESILSAIFSRFCLGK